MLDLENQRALERLEAAWLDPDYDFAPSRGYEDELFNRADDEYQERMLRRYEQDG